MERETISVTVNGRAYERTVEPRRLLSDFLRDDLRLTGTHVGCEHGVCGSCTVMMDGVTARSCLTFAVMADSAEIETIEGLGTVDAMHPVQQAFWEKHGLQCGFCTPGMLMTAVELLKRNPGPLGRRHPGRDLRQSLPLHRLSDHRGVDPARGAPDAGGRLMSERGHIPESRQREKPRVPICNGSARA